VVKVGVKQVVWDWEIVHLVQVTAEWNEKNWNAPDPASSVSALLVQLDPQEPAGCAGTWADAENHRSAHAIDCGGDE